MAQTVKVPRFYINELEWLDFNNHAELPSSHFRTLPVIPEDIDFTQLTFPYTLENPFCFILGHTNVNAITFDGASKTGMLINENVSHDGWSFMELTATPISINVIGNVGSVVMGSYWEPPHSPDLSVKLTYDYSGIKNITTKSGANLSNSFYHKNPNWGPSTGAWELSKSSTNQKLAKSGRRQWDISFSFFQESDVFPASLNLSTEAENNATDDTLLTGTDDFYGQVIHRTAGHLPFIFSPDSTSSALDNFAICKFDQNKFSFQQQAPGLYSTKIRVKEVW